MNQVSSQRSSTDLLDHIRDIAFFKVLDEPLQQELAANLEQVSLAQGEYLFHEGDSSDEGMYVVLEGHLQVSVTSPTGEQLVVDEHGPGAVVGEIGLLTGGTRTATVQVTTRTALIRISQAAFNQLSRKNPQLLSQTLQLVLQRLQRPQLFYVLPNLLGPLDLPTFEEVEAELTWVHLARGEQLIGQGKMDDNLYVLVSGRLQVVTTDQTGTEQVVGEIGAGESVGEMHLLTGQARSATVYSVRDSELVRLTKASFDRLAAKYPQMMKHIAQLVIKRLQQTLHESSMNKPKLALDIVLVPLGSDVPLTDFTQRLARTLEEFGPTLVLNEDRFDAYLNKPGAAQIPADDPTDIRLVIWLNQQATRYQFRLFETDVSVTPWTKRCLRQADQVFLVGWANGNPALSEIEVELLARDDCWAGVRKRLVLLHPETTRWPVGTMKWLENRQVFKHHHVRWDSQVDLEHLVRFLTGRAVGLVFSGGGARGFAHMGVIRALQEANIPIDLIGGNSAGAVIAAEYALGWRYETMLETNKRDFKPLKFFDLTLPFVSVNTGRKRYQTFYRLFGDRRIEDLWLPYFCVSSNLTQAELVVHQTGPLWKGVMASTTLAGIMPPVVEDGDFLVDGNLLDDMPVEAMVNLCEGGTVIAVDVSPPIDLAHNLDFGPYLSGWRLLWNKLNPFAEKLNIPDIATIVQRAGELKSIASRKAKLKKNLVDLYLTPPVADIALFDFQAIDRAVSLGYEYAKEKVATWQESQATRGSGR